VCYAPITRDCAYDSLLKCKVHVFKESHGFTDMKYSFFKIRNCNYELVLRIMSWSISPRFHLLVLGELRMAGRALSA
jgi:hypothetical protein